MKEEKSLFLEFFGDTPRFRLMDFLLDNPFVAYTKKEIADGSNVSWASLFNHWEELEKSGIVKVMRTIGRVKLYQLNDSSPLVKQLKQIEWELIKKAADGAEDEASIKIRAKAGASRKK
ncbi:Uncharacterised protein [uncultured archaeon]|nr:Uncharacterised protein [uncultured archaeon]